MNLCDVKECTGCGACLNACPKNCISMKRDLHGFDFPQVNESQCIRCRACQEACPQLHGISRENDMALIYAGQLRHEDSALRNSTSGGIAYALSEYIIRRGGIVFGAAYDENMRVTHIAVDQMEDLPRLQGSKYVQSYIGTSYRKVKEALKRGKEVLFIGVTCQVAGLYQFLGRKSPSGLLTCDLLCAGGTSPGLFQHYIKQLEKYYRTSICDYKFRDKQYGYGFLSCSIIASGKKKYFVRGSEAGYVRTMGAGYIRESCFDCRYASVKRIGDISLGDFWHVSDHMKDYEKGISIIFANSAKGKALLQELGKDSLWLEQHTEEEARASQNYALKRGRKKPQDYDVYFRDAFTMPWAKVYRQYLRSASWKMELIDRLPIQVVSFLLRAKRSVQAHDK